MSKPSEELQSRLVEMICASSLLMRALRAARTVDPPDWLIGAGVIRDRVWDKLHGFPRHAQPTDIDLAFFDPSSLGSDRERGIQSALTAQAPDISWDVTNQAAVHLWYPEVFGVQVAPLSSCADAVGTWPETATAVGIRLLADERIQVIAPCGLDDLFGPVCRRNPRRATREHGRVPALAPAHSRRRGGIRAWLCGDERRGHSRPRAHVSRKTFYGLFQSRDDCFLAVLEEALAHMARVAAPAYEGERRPSRRLRAALAALLEHLEGEREMGTLAVAYLLGAGPKDPERRARVLTTLRSVVEDGHSHAKPTHKPSPLTPEILLGGALAIIHARLHTNQGRLIPLVNPLMSMIVQPYLGPAAAAKELRRTPPKPAETPPEPARTPSEPAGTPPQPPREPVKDLGIPVTYRTARVMAVIAVAPGLSNAEISARAGIEDQGQISRLLARLAGLGLIENTGGGQAKGAPNAWRLTRTGKEVESAIRRRSATDGR